MARTPAPAPNSNAAPKEPPPRKKLIEVSIPLAAINAASAKEKSIRHGHPSTLHLWWARRPLAACRAVLFCSLVDDPESDPRYLRQGEIGLELAAEKRAELHSLIEELVVWKNSNDPDILGRARAEIARCVASRKIETGDYAADDAVPETAPEEDGHDDLPKFEGAPPPAYTFGQIEGMNASREQVNHFLATQAPPVLDPFCGGGSIPLEAQRLGLRAVGSDLNPVAVLITKALIEIPPKFAGQPPVHPGQSKKLLEKQWKGAEGLAEDVRFYGKWMRDEAEKRIGHLYPKVQITEAMAADRPDLEKYVGRELTVIAWLWARTVASPNPAARGAHVPLARSFWLSKKQGKLAWIEPVADRAAGTFRFEVRVGEPNDEHKKKIGAGTVNRRGGTCLLTGDAMKFPYIRSEGQQRRMRHRMTSIALAGDRERVYVPATDEQVEVAEAATPNWTPAGDLADNARDFKTPNYGMETHASLYTKRQATALATFCEIVRNLPRSIADEAARLLPQDSLPLRDCGRGARAYGEAVSTYVGMLVDKYADLANSLCAWEPLAQCPRHLFARQAIPMVWDYAEGNPFGESSGSWDVLLRNTANAFESPLFEFHRPSGGRSFQKDAIGNQYGLGKIVISTDPPYYDNISYAELSDFFYVWLRRSLGDVYPQLAQTIETPKKRELIAAPHRHGGDNEAANAFYEKGFRSAFSWLPPQTAEGVPVTIFYAFKQVEKAAESQDLAEALVSTGWEKMLAGIIAAGYTVEGTWPMRTEMKSRMIGMGNNALASSIILVCRPRPADAPTATRREFKRLLDAELPDALAHLRAGGIAPVDLAQAAIGPGMAVFTRHQKVLESDGAAMTVRTALGLINEVLDASLAEAEGDFDRDTRWAVAWFEQHGPAEGPYGDAETLSNAKNTSVDGLVRAGVITSRAGKVRLVPRPQLPADWSPATDDRLTVWEACQHLIRVLEADGEAKAAALLAELGAEADKARDLAYRLYSFSERKKLSAEGRAYNGLITAWPELSRLSREVRRERQTQGSLLGD